MIFIILFILFVASAIPTLRFRWLNPMAQKLFYASSVGLALLLLLFSLDFKIKIQEPVASRRTLITLMDISASTGLDFEKTKQTLSDKFTGYNLLIIPFSDRIRGAQSAQGTALIDSILEIQKYAMEKFPPEEIAGLLVISDGNETEKINTLHRFQSPSSAIPLHVIYLKSGNKKINFDKAVTFLKVPKFIPIFQKAPITFAVNVIGSNLKSVPVELKLNGKSSGVVQVELDHNGYGEGKYDLILKKLGEALFEAKISIDSRENLIDNNRDALVVDGILKGIRVLHISGHPSADTAFVRRGLQNIPGVDMISFFILRTNQQLGFTAQDELSLIQFPTDQLFKKELDNFDLIIMNDFGLTKFLSPQYINNIARFVAAGGGLLLMGGPESFMQKDFIATNFDNVVPVIPSATENWQEKNYSIQKNPAALFTSLGNMEIPAHIQFKGLNQLKIKDWANVFYKNSFGGPVIAGGVVNKGRVLTILTDSFWKISFLGKIPNEETLKPLIRYVLGISLRPVRIHDGMISFDRNSNKFPLAKKNIRARLIFQNFAGQLKKEEVIGPDDFYQIKENDPSLIRVQVQDTAPDQKNVTIDSFNLIHLQGKKVKEFEYLPQGEIFLKSLAEKSSGSFIISDLSQMNTDLDKISLKTDILVQESSVTYQPLYQHKGILVLVAYLALLAFFLKSRYTYFED